MSKPQALEISSTEKCPKLHKNGTSRILGDRRMTYQNIRRGRGELNAQLNKAINLNHKHTHTRNESR